MTWSISTQEEQGGFLRRVRVALAGAGASVPRSGAEDRLADWAERAAQIRAEALRRWEELLPRFTAEVEAVAGAVYRAAPSAVPALVARIAKERNLSRVVTWAEAAVGLPGLVAGLRAEGLGVEANPETADGVREHLISAEIGVTGVDFAVAESGSLVLASGPGKGRLVSCLPTVHVAILRPGQLVGTLEEIGVLLEELHHQAPPGESPSAITFVTGPSRTADIELSLTRGVHGPKEVHVIALT